MLIDYKKNYKIEHFSAVAQEGLIQWKLSLKRQFTRVFLNVVLLLTVLSVVVYASIAYGIICLSNSTHLSRRWAG